MELGCRRVLTRVPDVAELSLFAGCGRDQLSQIRRLLTPIMLPAGALVIARGVPAREFCIIADGEVSVTADDGTELAVLGAGAIVGEIGLLRHERTGATVTTLTPVVLYVGNGGEFESMLDASADISHRVLEVALDRIR
ncbi:MAG: cyclic nucleotide-binding domain-containing protein [Ilumatobacteraceae bacterium]